MTFDEPFYNFTVMESDRVTEIVGVVSVQPANIPLWFDIVGKPSRREISNKSTVWFVRRGKLTRNQFPGTETAFVMLKRKWLFNILLYYLSRFGYDALAKLYGWICFFLSHNM